jgi:hypothetical protein
MRIGETRSHDHGRGVDHGTCLALSVNENLYLLKYREGRAMTHPVRKEGCVQFLVLLTEKRDEFSATSFTKPYLYVTAYLGLR